MNNENSSTSEKDSQALLNQVIIDYMREQKNKRRWRWAFRIFFLLVFIVIFIKAGVLDINKEDITQLTPHVGLIDVKGTIFEGQSAGSDNFVKSLDKAYKSKAMKALLIRINSPGGSPVQAEYMYNGIRHYQKKYPDIKVYAVCVDVCASAAYYIAAAADDIYASPASIVGSIGVLYNGFGFVDAMDKIGVSRRMMTAGKYKGFLDPFSPEQPMDKQKMSTMLDIIHQQFISRVKEGRKGRLLIDDETFSGLFWTGEQSVGRGLVDGLASSGQVVREKIKLDEVVDYTYKPNVLELFAKSMGTAMANQLPAALGVKQGFQ